MPTTDYRAYVSGIATVGGLWAILAPFLLSVGGAFRWSNVIVGAAVALLAGFATYRAEESDFAIALVAGIAVLGGLWLVVAPFVFVVTATEPLASNVLTGIVVALLSAYRLYLSSDTSVEGFGRPTT